MYLAGHLTSTCMVYLCFVVGTIEQTIPASCRSKILVSGIVSFWHENKTVGK